jgi:hypothetical protein
MSSEELDLENEWCQLDALAVVNTVRLDEVTEKTGNRQGRKTSRVICTLWCCSTHPAGDLRQPSVKVNQSSMPDVEHAVRALREKIEKVHAGCIIAAEEARAAADAPSTRQPSDALASMMAHASSRRLDKQAAAAEARAEAARKEADRLRAVADAAWAPLQDAAHAKRQRVDDGGANLECWKPWLEGRGSKVATYDLEQWQLQYDKESRRRDVKIGEPAELAAGREPPAAPKTGKDGFLQHSRRGLIGAVQSWARGSKEHVVSMLVALISSEHGFGVASEVRKRLENPKQARLAETNALIVDRVVATLSTLKQCGTEQARQQYHIVSGAASHERILKLDASGKEHDISGMARRFAARLGVRRGRRTRTKKQLEICVCVSSVVSSCVCLSACLSVAVLVHPRVSPCLGQELAARCPPS